MTSVYIGESVEIVGINAFYGCSSLPDVEFPDGLTDIASYAFCGCGGLKQ